MGLLKRLRRAAPEPELTLDRLHLLLSQAVVQQLIGPDEGHMLQRVLSLADRPLSAMMIPKSAVVAVPAEAGITEIIERYQACGFSRIPVYEDNADNIIGIIHLKELLRFWHRPVRNLRAVEFIRLPHFFPGTMKVTQALTEFRKRKISIAVVIDEYGAPVGLVTAEDLVEQIVGEMRDELDRERSYHRPDSDGWLIVAADMPLAKFCELAGCAVDSKARTVSGLVQERLQRIPAAGEEFRIDGLACRVLEATPAKLITIKVLPASG